MFYFIFIVKFKSLLRELKIDAYETGAPVVSWAIHPWVQAGSPCQLKSPRRIEDGPTGPAPADKKHIGHISAGTVRVPCSRKDVFDVRREIFRSCRIFKNK